MKGFVAKREILEENGKQKIPFNDINIQKNVQNRVSKETDTYIVGGTIFKEGCGLYFLEKGKDLLPELKFLGENGIGGNRSLGMGRFKVRKESMEIKIPGDADCLVLLSLCLPREEEIGVLNSEKTRYILEKRVGWINGTSIRQKGFRMLKEGSVVEKKEDGLIGSFPSSADKEKAYRYGYGMTIPLKWQDDQKL